jgi:hypothetical protein
VARREVGEGGEIGVADRLGDRERPPGYVREQPAHQ